MFKDILKVGSTNIIKMLVSLLVAFALPKVLTVDDYGYFKLYQFYCTYVGISHLGFCDGIYLKYGGKKIHEIDKEKASLEFSSLFVYEVIISLIAIIIGCFAHDFTIVSLGLVATPMVMVTFMSYVFQATGEFSKYSKILSTAYFINFILYGILLIVGIQNYIPFVLVAISVEYIMFILYIISYREIISIKLCEPNMKCLVSNMKYGILLTVGNVVYALFVGVDKWFIKFSLPISDFSMYSFASQMITIVNMVITPISMTLYNYFSKKNDREFEKTVKRFLVLLLMLMPILIYCINIVIKFYLPKYAEAKDTISLLIITQIFWGLNSAIFMNLYKVYKQQKQYFIRISISLGIAAVLDSVVMIVSPNITGYAFATLVTTLIWLIMNTVHFSYMKPTIKEILFVSSLLAIYIVTIQLSILIKMIIYIFAYLVLSLLLMRNEIKQGKQMVINLGIFKRTNKS